MEQYTFERLWEEYLEELGKVGLDKYEAYLQQQINKRIERWTPRD